MSVNQRATQIKMLEMYKEKRRKKPGKEFKE
jgi:hypothetical protein